MVKPEGVRGGQQCIFDVFLTKPVGINENLGGGGVERHQGAGGLPAPTYRALLRIKTCISLTRIGSKELSGGVSKEQARCASMDNPNNYARLYRN